MDLRTDRTVDFYHPDYRVARGGCEEWITYKGKNYLYVWNRVERKHEYYVSEDDMFIADDAAPWIKK